MYIYIYIFTYIYTYIYIYVKEREPSTLPLPHSQALIHFLLRLSWNLQAHAQISSSDPHSVQPACWGCLMHPASSCFFVIDSASSFFCLSSKTIKCRGF